MNAVEIVGNLYIRGQVLEEQLNQVAAEKAALEEMVKSFKSKEYAARFAKELVFDTAVGTDDDPEEFQRWVDVVEKLLNDPKLLIPDVPEVTEAQVIAAREAADAEASQEPESELVTQGEAPRDAAGA